MLLFTDLVAHLVPTCIQSLFSIYTTEQHFFRPARLTSIDSTKHSMLVTAVWSTNRSMHVRDDHPYVFFNLLGCSSFACGWGEQCGSGSLCCRHHNYNYYVIGSGGIAALFFACSPDRCYSHQLIFTSSDAVSWHSSTLCGGFTGIPAHSVDFMYVLCIYHKRIISSFHPFDLQHDQCMSHSPEQQS